jgi:Helix-turn-helix domain
VCDHSPVFEIGNSLREARSRRQVGLPQAEQATKIRVKYLRALEDERFEQLPSDTYVKGFLRNYADYLGLDGQLYVDEYTSRYVIGEDFEQRPRRSSVRPERRTRRIETSIVLIAVALVAVVTLVVLGAWQTSRSTGGKKPPSRLTPTHPHQTPKKPQAYLQIQAVSGSSYVAVHRGGPGGPLLFAGTIDKGSLEPFTGRFGKIFWINVSSPENLIITVAGKRVTLGGLHPASLTVTATGVRTA